MKRKVIKAASVTQSNDASCIGNKRGMARRAKRHSAKCQRQFLQKENEREVNES